MSEAYEMAVDALGLTLEDRIKDNDVPVPTPVDQLSPEEDAYTVIIEFDLLEYRKKALLKKPSRKPFPSPSGSMKKPWQKASTFHKFCGMD